MTAATPPVDAVSTAATRPLRRDRDFRRYWGARVSSIAGTAATYVAMPVLMYGLTGSAFYTGLLTAIESVPYVVFGLIGGAVADRYDRRIIMVRADLLNVAVLGSIPLAAALGVLTVGHLLVVAVLTSTLFVFFDAANFGALPTLVGKDRVAAANGAIWSASTGLEIVIPAAAGALVAVIHPAWVIAFNAGTFLASGLLIRAISRPLVDLDRLAVAGKRTLVSLASEAAEGLRFLWHHPTIRPMTLVNATQSVAGGAVVGQLVPYAREALGIGEDDNGLGIMFGAWGLGALIASLLIRRISQRMSPPTVALYTLPASAVCGLAFALAPTFPLAVLALGCWGIAYILIVVNAVIYRQQETPEHLQSRVNVTGRLLSWGVGYTLGGLGGGVVATLADPRWAMGSAAACVAAGVVVGWTSALRTARH